MSSRGSELKDHAAHFAKEFPVQIFKMVVLKVKGAWIGIGHGDESAGIIFERCRLNRVGEITDITPQLHMARLEAQRVQAAGEFRQANEMAVIGGHSLAIAKRHHLDICLDDGMEPFQIFRYFMFAVDDSCRQIVVNRGIRFRPECSGCQEENKAQR